MITVNSKQIQAVFAAYESARTKFVTTISELALRPRNIYGTFLSLYISFTLRFTIE